MIYPPDNSPAAKKGRRLFDMPEPDFLVDGRLVAPSKEEIPVQADVNVRVFFGEDDWPNENVTAEVGEPIFHFNVVDAEARRKNTETAIASVSQEGYWVALSKLPKKSGAWPHTKDRERWPRRYWPLYLDEQTREAMLVWWDEHADEVMGRISEQPSAEEVEYHLQRAGLRFHRERSGGADWSVDAWSLGGDVYLTDNDGEGFSLIRRDMASEDDEIQELAEGTLGEMLDAAPEFLR